METMVGSREIIQHVPWFYRFLSESESSSKIKREDMYKFYRATIEPGKIPVSQTVFGRLLKKIFRNVKISRVYQNGKQIWAYQGLSYSESTKENPIQISEIPSLPCLSKYGFFPMEVDSKSCKLGYVLQIKISGNPVFIELTLGVSVINDLTVDAFLFNQHMDASSLGMTKLPMTDNSVSLVLQVLKDITLCPGFTQNHGMETDAHLITKEKWETPHSMNNVYRSAKCKRVIRDILCEMCKVCRDQRNHFRKQAVGSITINNDTTGPPQQTNKQPDSSPNRSSADSQQPSVVSSTSLTTEELIRQLFPGIEDESGLRALIKAQVNKSKGEKRNYRWSPQVINFSLMLWGRSQKAYDDLGRSGLVIIPSSRLLRYYKYGVQQKAGIQHKLSG